MKTGLDLLSTLTEAMRFESARARVLADNVANAETAGFKPKDIAGGDFAAALEAAGGARPRRVVLASTVAGHVRPPDANIRRWKVEAAPDAEVTLDGNGVVLEEQMAKVAEARMRYEAAVSLYQKTLGFLRMAAKSPTR